MAYRTSVEFISKSISTAIATRDAKRCETAYLTPKYESSHVVEFEKETRINLQLPVRLLIENVDAPRPKSTSISPFPFHACLFDPIQAREIRTIIPLSPITTPSLAFWNCLATLRGSSTSLGMQSSIDSLTRS